MRITIANVELGANDMTKIRLIKAITITITAISAGLILMYGPFVLMLTYHPWDDAEFRQETWLASPNYQARAENLRGPMTDDLIQNHLPLGMSKNAVRKLLGKPLYLPYKKNIDSYYVGHWGFMTEDGEFLTIHYNQANQIEYAKLIAE